MKIAKSYRIVGREVRVGTLAVSAVFALLMLSWALAARQPGWLVARNVFLAGFVGGFTNTIAIRMLFERLPLVPGSGILLDEKEAIIRALADTMSSHILNVSLVEGRVRELSAGLDATRLTATANRVLDALRPALVAHIDTPANRARARDIVREQGGSLGEMANSFGLMTYDELAAKLLDSLKRQVERFRVTPEHVSAAMARVGSVDAFLLHPDNPLLVEHFGLHASLAETLFERLDTRQLVIDKLSAYEATQIRDIIARHVEEHMTWLEVFGVLLGLLFAGVAAGIDRLF